MKKYDVRSCKILQRNQLTQDVFDVTVDAGELAKLARPGQFAQIAVPGRTLRRPISICEIDAEHRTLRFVFQVRGEGTAILAGFEPGEALDVLAPLGNGFDLGGDFHHPLFVGGGIGLPPLLAAAEKFGSRAVVAAGFRSRDAVILRDDFESCGCKMLIATDDGSLGHHGLVTELFDGLSFDAVFACGPLPMLRAVSVAARSAAFRVRFRWKNGWPAASAHVSAVRLRCAARTAANVTVTSARMALYSTPPYFFFRKKKYAKRNHVLATEEIKYRWKLRVDCG